MWEDAENVHTYARIPLLSHWVDFDQLLQRFPNLFDYLVLLIWSVTNQEKLVMSERI